MQIIKRVMTLLTWPASFRACERRKLTKTRFSKNGKFYFPEKKLRFRFDNFTSIRSHGRATTRRGTHFPYGEFMINVSGRTIYYIYFCVLEIY